MHASDCLQNGSDRSVSFMSVMSCLSVCNVGVLRPNGWNDQGETWHGGWPRPRPHCVDVDPAPKKGHILAHLCCDQTVGWMMPFGTQGLGSGDIVLDGTPLSPKEEGTAPQRILAHVYIVVKRLDGVRCHLV